jgi:hypothetical protein
MTRDDLIDHLRPFVSAYEPIRAAWLGGSDASGRSDALSDVDFMIIAEDDAVDDVVAAIERRVLERWTIQAQYRVVTKCVERGQPTDAMQFYRMMTLIPLVEMLRIHHCPDRFDFGLRYLDRDLPEDLNQTIDRLSFAASMEELLDHHREAVGLFQEYSERPVPAGSGT